MVSSESQQQPSRGSEQWEPTARTTADSCNEGQSSPAAVMKTERHVLASKPPRANAQQAAPTSGKSHGAPSKNNERRGGRDIKRCFRRELIGGFYIVSPAPAADVETKEDSPPAVEVKRQAVVSHIPTTKMIPPVNPPVNNPAPPRPPPDRTEDEDIDYDSDDASKTQIRPLLIEHERVCTNPRCAMNSGSNRSMFICFRGKMVCPTGVMSKFRLHFFSSCVFILAATLGSLEFSLLYAQESHALHCCIVKAKVNTRRDKIR